MHRPPSNRLVVMDCDCRPNKLPEVGERSLLPGTDTGASTAEPCASLDCRGQKDIAYYLTGFPPLIPVGCRRYVLAGRPAFWDTRTAEGHGDAESQMGKFRYNKPCCCCCGCQDMYRYLLGIILCGLHSLATSICQMIGSKMAKSN